MILVFYFITITLMFNHFLIMAILYAILFARQYENSTITRLYIIPYIKNKMDRPTPNVLYCFGVV